MEEKKAHDKEYLEMKKKYEDMKKQILEKDKYIVDMGKASEKNTKNVDDVKGSLEKTYLAKIKGRSGWIRSAGETAGEGAGGAGAEPDDSVSEQDGAGEDRRSGKADSEGREQATGDNPGDTGGLLGKRGLNEIIETRQSRVMSSAKSRMNLKSGAKSSLGNR